MEFRSSGSPASPTSGYHANERALVAGDDDRVGQEYVHLGQILRCQLRGQQHCRYRRGTKRNWSLERARSWDSRPESNQRRMRDPRSCTTGAPERASNPVGNSVPRTTRRETDVILPVRVARSDHREDCLTTCLWLACVKHLSYSPVTSERYHPWNATEGLCPFRMIGKLPKCTTQRSAILTSNVSGIQNRPHGF